MYNQHLYELGLAPSVIRELFSYGIQKAAEVGAENIYDYSIGNPSIPAPAPVNAAIKNVVDEIESTILHGYSMAPGLAGTRDAVAANLKKRFGGDITGNDIFMTCGAAPALIMLSLIHI